MGDERVDLRCIEKLTNAKVKSARERENWKRKRKVEEQIERGVEKGRWERK